MSKKACAFTGHRPEKLPFGENEQDKRCIDLKATLRAEIEKLIEEGVTHFLCGMARGVDTFAAEAVLELKLKYPQITLESVIPYENQAINWNESDRERYYDIASKCDKETMLQTKYTKGCLHRRNEYMVNNADILLAVWDGTLGGTGYTVNYAKRKEKPIITIKI